MSAIFGHAAAQAAFGEAMAGARPHHAWLFAGPRGVGKASFARAAAGRLLADAAGPPIAAAGWTVPEDHRIGHLLRAGSHPDFRLLDRLVREKGGDLARNITVDQVRALQQLFATTPSLSDRRVVIIDAMDDLEAAAANALLKSLEEPPAGTLFLLVSHTPGRLLPTIRSRCRLLRFGLLEEAEARAVLAAQLPEADASEIAALVAAGAGAPGRAIDFAGLDLGAIDAAITTLIDRGDPTNTVRSGLARKLATKAAQPRYEAFLARVPVRIADHARRLSGEPLAAAIGAWEQARALTGGAVRLSLDPQSVTFEVGGILAALAPAPTPAKA